MQEFVVVTGLVIKSIPVGDYDRRITILTKERGKIGAFAKGTRRPNSRLAAATNPFSFGEFKLYEGKSAYNLMEADIFNYFKELRENFEAAFFGMYFLEVADYYTRENNDERQMLKLLYQSLKALLVPSLKMELVQYIFEMKALVVNGEFPGPLHREDMLSDTVYAIEYVTNSSIEKLYTFTLSEPVFKEFEKAAEEYRKHYIGRNFKSLEILQNCRLKK
ncbi:MAG: DNA repair protein RecO [Lachnospiraceae bacterium]|nr:DNA repair protein RecO [Lachnospiraceae bacterium]